MIDPPARHPLAIDDYASRGDRVALIADGVAIGYAELAERIDSRRGELGSGRRLVRIACENDVESLVTYLATLAGGHVAWLTGQGAAPDTPITPDVDAWTEHGRANQRAHGGEPRHDLHHELCLLLGTSGSTGAPRLVRLSREAVDANAAAIVEYLGITSADRAITTLPMHYCYGLSVLHSHLLAGASLVLTGASVADPELFELASAHRATSFAGVPRTFELLDRTGFAEMDLPDLRYVTQAGGRLAPETVRRYADLGTERGWDLVVMYGQTEATARMAYLPPELASDTPGSIGVPIPGGELDLRPVDEWDEPGVGELVYRGPNVMLGYAERAADLARGPDIEELATGDLARRDEHGRYEIVGRRSRFVKLFGLRVDLGQVERMLAEDGVEAASSGSDERIVVAVTEDDEGLLAETVAARIGVPASRVVVAGVPEIPRTPNGKPDYPAIDAMAPHEPVGDVAGASVAGALAQALGRREVGDDDSFASLGGDSLSYVEASVALEEIVGTLPADWPEMTVAELSALRERPGERSRFLGRMETDVALRASAIALVVASHMTDLWPAGGAHLLLALAGFSFARFQLGGIDAPGRARRWLGSIGRVAIPSAAYIALLALLVGGYGLAAVLLVNNVVGDPALTGARWHYWFIEALVQILIVATVVFSIPAVRCLERRWPFSFPLALTAVLLIPASAIATIGSEPSRYFLTAAVAWIFALGWAAFRARTLAQRLLVSALALASLGSFWDDAVRGGVVLAGVLVLLWLPSVAVPRALVRGVAIVAAASLAIYLTHWQIYPELLEAMPVTPAFLMTMAAGVLIWVGVQSAVSLGRGPVRRWIRTLHGRAAGRTDRRWPTEASAGRR